MLRKLPLDIPTGGASQQRLQKIAERKISIADSVANDAECLISIADGFILAEKKRKETKIF